MKYTMVGLTLFLLVTSAWAGTMTDNFDDGNMDNWIYLAIPPEQATWQIKDGELVIRTNIAMAGFGVGDKTWSDYAANVRMKITEHQPLGGWTVGAGLFLRGDLASGSTDGYTFDLGTFDFGGKEAFAFYMKGDTLMRNRVAKAFPWELNTWYEMKVAAQGNRFEFYVNNELMIEYMDNTFPSGGVAFGVGAGMMEVHFDDFAVTGDNVPDMNISEGVISSIKPEAKLTTTWAELKTN